MCHCSLLAIHFLVVVNSTKMGIQLNNLQPTCGLQENNLQFEESHVSSNNLRSARHAAFRVCFLEKRILILAFQIQESSCKQMLELVRCRTICMTKFNQISGSFSTFLTIQYSTRRMRARVHKVSIGQVRSEFQWQDFPKWVKPGKSFGLLS